jgi:quaternary ammonium compound-resistance protein SugE
MTNSYWIYLIAAGIFEIGWPLGLKLSEIPSYKILGPIIAVVSMTISGILLWLSLKGISIGTAYAVWTGIGATGTFIIGVLFFNDPSILLRWIGVSLIILGVLFLKVS